MWLVSDKLQIQYVDIKEPDELYTLTIVDTNYF